MQVSINITGNYSDQDIQNLIEFLHKPDSVPIPDTYVVRGTPNFGHFNIDHPDGLSGKELIVFDIMAYVGVGNSIQVVPEVRYHHIKEVEELVSMVNSIQERFYKDLSFVVDNKIGLMYINRVK